MKYIASLYVLLKIIVLGMGKAGSDDMAERRF